MRLPEIKNKIGLTQSIFGVTKALELVSAVKMKRATKLALGSRPFARKVVGILKRLSEYEESSKEVPFYFVPAEGKKILAVVIGSNKGFCGLYNKNILKFAEKEVVEFKKEAEVEIMAIGKKTINYFKKKNFHIRAEFLEVEDYEKFEKVKPLAALLFKYYREGEYQKILLYGTHYFNPFFQVPRKIQVLPLKKAVFAEMLEKLAGESVVEKRCEYIFEPSLKEIIEQLVLRLIEFEIYHAILEANASEHASRMMAMKRAMDNAKEIIKDLTLEYNKSRQAQITAEVCEITSAKEATI